ncbi:unnamed protein product [Amoebophrya sp. A120]|nr:unnamed protein product [Amoebophrya sp. A120]|eukprot:GSA120T00011568001.1
MKYSTSNTIMSGSSPSAPSSSSMNCSFLSIGMDNFLGQDGHSLGRKVLGKRFRFEKAGIGNFLQFAREKRVTKIEDYLRRMNDDELYVCDARDDKTLFQHGKCAYLGDVNEITKRAFLQQPSAAKYSFTTAAQRWDASRDIWTAKNAPYVAIPSISVDSIDLARIRNVPTKLMTTEYGQAEGYYPLGMPPDHGHFVPPVDSANGLEDFEAESGDAPMAATTAAVGGMQKFL